MANLILVRHAEYDSIKKGSFYDATYDFSINEKERKQIEELCGEIVKMINGQSAYIISSPNILHSPDEITYETARSLSQHLNAGIECSEFLVPGTDPEKSYVLFNGGAENLMKILNERRNIADNLIVVSGGAVCGDFTHYLRRCGYKIPEEQLGKGKYCRVSLDFSKSLFPILYNP